MKLEVGIDIEEFSIGDIDTIEAGIETANLPFIYSLVSSKFYSNPIGSIVREIASNSWDAHIEAGHNKPIIIKLDYDLENDGYYIEFIDNGLGLNEERVKKVFMNWFTSTKRGDNNAIGGFGLGSKSPFSYTDHFMIKTVADGYEYNYILHKGDGTPKLDRLKKVESDLPTGTTIRIDIKNYSDKEAFRKEIKKQLYYFDSVYVKNAIEKEDNNYRIYDCNTYKYRNTKDVYSEMHLVIGTVVYPIDWFTLYGSHYGNNINIPVGVKFAIGEINVTPNREQIEYKEETKILIKERIENVLNELRTQFNEQSPVLDNLEEFIIRRKEIPHIKFKFGEDQYDTLILNDEKLGIRNKVIFSPLKEIKIIPENLFFEYRTLTVSKGIESKRGLGYVHTNNWSNLPYWYRTDNPTKYNNISLQSGTIILQRRKQFRDICEELGFKSYKGYYYSWYKRVSNNTGNNGISAVRPQLGIAHKVYQYRKVIREYIDGKTKEYPNVSEQWIKDYKRSLKDDSAAQERRKNKIILCKNSTGVKSSVAIKDLEKSKIVFYCMEDEDIFVDKIDKYENLLKYHYKKNLFTFIVVNKTNLKFIKDLKNLEHVENFFKTPELQKIFNKLVLAVKWYHYNEIYREYRIATVSDYYENIRIEIRKFVDTYYSNVAVKLEEELLKIPKKNHVCTWTLRQKKKELDKFIAKADILKYIYANTPEQYLKIIIKQIKVTKLKEQLYGNYQVQTNRTEFNS